MIKRVSSFLFFALVLQLNFNISVASNNEKGDGTIVRFIKQYLVTEKNPIFGDYKNGLSIAWSDCFNSYSMIYKGNYVYNSHRAINSVNIHYSQPDKLLRVHGRLSVGIFSLHGVSGIYKDLYSAVGIEVIQELIFGTPTFYVSAGIGPSFIFAGKTGRVGKNEYGYREYGLTKFNFASVIKVGHRFDFKKFSGIVEISYRHYSNGNLDSVNEGVDMIGADIGIVF